MPVLKGKAKVKAPRAIAAGEEFEVEGLEVDIAQDIFDESVKSRLKRETEKQEQLTERIEAQAVEIAALKKKAETAPATDKDKERLAALEKDLTETKDKLKVKERQEKVASRIQVKAKDLPPIYRERIKVKDDAEDDEIDEAIEAQKAEFEEFKKQHGIKDASADDENIGRGGNGGPSGRSTTEGAKALEQVKLVPSLAKTIANYDQPVQEQVAVKWIQDGTLEKARAEAVKK